MWATGIVLVVLLVDVLENGKPGGEGRGEEEPRASRRRAAPERARKNAAGESGARETEGKSKRQGDAGAADGFSEFDGRVQHRIEMTLRATTPHDRSNVPGALRSFQSFGY